MVHVLQLVQTFAGVVIPNDPNSPPPDETGSSRGDSLNLPEITAGPEQVRNLLTVVFGIIGAVALVYIIIGGLNYIYSSGEPQKAKQAKETIIYALIGLVVAVTAETIVWTVLSKL
jgi:hypothetical protein